MPKPIPFPTGQRKDPPQGNMINTPVPTETEPAKDIPVGQQPVKEEPSVSPLDKSAPAKDPMNKENPEASELNKEMPKDEIPENCVRIEGQLIEIKPTKLKYFRNKMALNYGIIKAVPLNEFLTYEKGTFDENKDADQILYDFLVSAFDDPIFVRDHYDDMTADDVERVIEIFGRLNHIDEKTEKARKNREAQAKP